VTARAALAAVLLAGCAGCGSSSGLHIENGGSTVRPPRASPSTPAVSTAPAPPPVPGVRLGGPAAMAYDAGRLWCAVQPRGAALVGSLVKVSTATGRVSGPPVPLPPAGRPYLLAVGSDGVWLAAGRRLWKIDPATGGATEMRLDGRATALLDAAGSVWLTETTAAGGRLLRVAPATGSVVERVAVGPAPSAVTVAGGVAWVTDAVDQSVLRFAITPTGVRRTAVIALPRSSRRAPTEVTVYAGLVWVYERGRVLRIAPQSGRVVGTTRVAPTLRGTIAAGGGGVWVIVRTHARHKGAVRLLDGATGLAVGRRIAIDGTPSAIATDAKGAWVLDSRSGRLTRVLP
jgi:streptogramin lyase